jgi:hypothetical protein
MQVWTNSIIGGEVDRYDYDLVQNEDTAVIRYANNGDWVYPGQVCGMLCDDGNSVRIKLDGQKINLDYDSFERLFILMLHHNKSKVQFLETKVIMDI